jgi:hypothetical protein
MGLSTLRQFWAIVDCRGRFFTGGAYHEGNLWWTEDRRSPYVLRFATEAKAKAALRLTPGAFADGCKPVQVDVKQSVLFEEVSA